MAHPCDAGLDTSPSNSSTRGTRQQITDLTHVFPGTKSVSKNVGSELLRRICARNRLDLRHLSNDSEIESLFVAIRSNSLRIYLSAQFTTTCRRLSEI